MPLTPFHLGPALLIGLFLFKLLHLPTFLVANVIVDLHSIIMVLTGHYLTHGLMHTFLGGAFTAALLSLIMTWFDEKIQKIMSVFKLKQNHCRKKIWFTSFAGVYLHIILDSLLYTDIKPFYPLNYNPFYSLLGSSEVYILCALSFILASAYYVCCYLRH